MSKKFATIALSAMILPVIAVASFDDDDRYEHRYERDHSEYSYAPKAERLSKRLGLSDAQQAELEKIFSEQRETRKAMRENMQQLISAVLTEEQKEEFKEMRERRGESCEQDGRRHHRMHW